MTEDEEQLRCRVEELKALCRTLEDERLAAESPVRARFADALEAAADDAKQLEAVQAKHTLQVRANESQRQAFERARLFALWRSARGSATWLLLLTASASLFVRGEPAWAAAVPVGFALVVSTLFEVVGKRWPGAKGESP